MGLGVVVDDRRNVAHPQGGRDPVDLLQGLDLVEGIIRGRRRRLEDRLAVGGFVVGTRQGVFLELSVLDRLVVSIGEDFAVARIARHDAVFHIPGV